MESSFQTVIEWREALSKMDDYHFFDLLRMYLGEIKTPYNKQKLIEDLSSFLRKEENKQNILALLSERDCEILTTIYLIKKPTQSKIKTFFENDFSIIDLYEHLMNLEERLLIFRFFDKDLGQTVIKINPLLEETLKPFLTKDKILSTSLELDTHSTQSELDSHSKQPVPCEQPELDSHSTQPVPCEQPELDSHSKQSELVSHSTQPVPCEQPDFLSNLQITPELLTAFICVVAEKHDLCKADGSFKKKFDTALQEVFPQYNKKLFESLLHGFLNLGLFRQKDDGVTVLYDRISNFAHLTELEQYVYLCIASTSHFPRDVLQRYSQLFMELLSNIPKSGYTRKNILKASLLLSEDFSATSSPRSSRFSELLKSYETQPENNTAPDINAFINNALLFNILRLAGTTKDGEEVFVVNAIPKTNNLKNVNIDSSFSVTIMPGLPLLKLAKLSKSLKVLRYDTVLQMEFTKKTALYAFSNSETPESIIFSFIESSNHDFPQSLKISLEEWFESYNSASLFKGYVLRIVAEKATLVEKNNILQHHILYTLAPGVFLMDFASDLDAKTAIEESGLDFIGSPKNKTQEVSVLPFPSLQRRSVFTVVNTQASKKTPTNESILAIKESLYASINESQLSPEEEEELKSRVSRGIVVNRSQLKAVSVRPEKNEAFGMDFVGKIYVIEHAITAQSLLQIKYNDTIYLGLPKSLIKQNGDAIVTLILEPQKEEKSFSVGQSQNIKRIRGSIFKEQAR